MTKKEEIIDDKNNPPKIFDCSGKSYFLIMIDNKTRRKDIKISIAPELMPIFESNLFHYLVVLNSRFHYEEDIQIESKNRTPEFADRTRYIG